MSFIVCPGVKVSNCVILESPEAKLAAFDFSSRQCAHDSLKGTFVKMLEPCASNQREQQAEQDTTAEGDQAGIRISGCCRFPNPQYRIPDENMNDINRKRKLPRSG